MNNNANMQDKYHYHLGMQVVKKENLAKLIISNGDKKEISNLKLEIYQNANLLQIVKNCLDLSNNHR